MACGCGGGATSNQAQARMRGANNIVPPTPGAGEVMIYWAVQPSGLSIEIGVPSARQYLVRNLNEQVIVNEADVAYFVQQGKASTSPVTLPA